jgi:hypothetical protein
VRIVDETEHGATLGSFRKKRKACHEDEETLV